MVRTLQPFQKFLYSRFHVAVVLRAPSRLSFAAVGGSMAARVDPTAPVEELEYVQFGGIF